MSSRTSTGGFHAIARALPLRAQKPTTDRRHITFWPVWSEAVTASAPEWTEWRQGWYRVVAILGVVWALGLSACSTGSPATQALRPDFEMLTSAGIASVSIREALPGVTGTEFKRMVMAGMEQAAPRSILNGPLTPPYPQRRIVWHVSPGIRGTSEVVVNIFDGTTPVAYAEASLPDMGPRDQVIDTIRSLTERLLATYRG